MYYSVGQNHKLSIPFCLYSITKRKGESLKDQEYKKRGEEGWIVVMMHLIFNNHTATNVFTIALEKSNTLFSIGQILPVFPLIFKFTSENSNQARSSH